MQRRRVEIGRHAGNQRQYDAAHEAERVKRRQRHEQPVLAAEIDARFGLRDVREHVAMGQHHAFGNAFGAGGEQDHGPIVRLARDQRLFRPQRAARACRRSSRFCECLPDKRCAPAARSAATSFSSRAFSTKACAVRMVSTCAARQAPRTLAAPAGEVDHGRDTPAGHQRQHGHHAAVGCGQHHADGAAFRRERHQLGAENPGRLQKPLVRQRPLVGSSIAGHLPP
jgi:hypothetical protein